MTTPTTQETDAPLTREQVAWLIRTLWTSLQAPGWTHKNRKDLEKIGEAIFTGKSLKDLDDALYERIFPHLVKIAECLGRALRSDHQDSPPQAPDIITTASTITTKNPIAGSSSAITELRPPDAGD